MQRKTLFQQPLLSSRNPEPNNLPLNSARRQANFTQDFTSTQGQIPREHLNLANHHPSSQDLLGDGDSTPTYE